MKNNFDAAFATFLFLSPFPSVDERGRFEMAISYFCGIENRPTELSDIGLQRICPKQQPIQSYGFSRDRIYSPDASYGKGKSRIPREERP